MSGTPARTPGVDDDGAAFPHRVFVQRSTAYRGRIVAVFLLLNWLIMGWFTIRAPAAWSAVLTTVLGLIALVAGISQWRAAQRALQEPMVRWNDEVFAFRPYTGPGWIAFRWQRLEPAPAGDPRAKQRRSPEDDVLVTADERRVVFLGWPEPDPEDQPPGADDLVPRSVLGLTAFEAQRRREILDALGRAGIG